MIKYWRLFFIFVVIHFVFVGCMQAKEPVVTPSIDFQLQDLNNNTFVLSQYKDKKPVILLFWTTWCPFCRKELRILNEKYPKLTKEGWEVLAVDVGEPLYKVDNLVKNYGLVFRVLLDRDSSVASAYDLLGVPTYVVINKKGNLVFKDNYFPSKEYKNLE